jgi:hypothetical protein
MSNSHLLLSRIGVSNSKKKINSRLGKTSGTGRVVRRGNTAATIERTLSKSRTESGRSVDAAYSNSKSLPKRSTSDAFLSDVEILASSRDKPTTVPRNVTLASNRRSMQTIVVPPEYHFSNNDQASSDLIMSVVPSDLIHCIPALAYISGRIDEATQARDEDSITRLRYRRPSQASRAKIGVSGRSYTKRSPKPRLPSKSKGSSA